MQLVQQTLFMRCTWVSSKVACSVMCQCCGDTQVWFNKETKVVDDLVADDED